MLGGRATHQRQASGLCHVQLVLLRLGVKARHEDARAHGAVGAVERKEVHEGAHALRQHARRHGLAKVLAEAARLVPRALHQHLGQHQLLHAQDHAVRALDAQRRARRLNGLVGILYLKDALPE